MSIMILRDPEVKSVVKLIKDSLKITTLWLFVIISIPLLSSSHSNFASSIIRSTLPSSQNITVPAGYFIPLEIESFSNSSRIVYNATSNISISIALMNAQQFNAFNSSQFGDISNSITYQKGTSSQQDIQVSSGAFYLVFLDDQNSPANVTVSYQIYPFTPFTSGSLQPPQPTGIASFGIYNESGNAVPYRIETSTLEGVANISSFQAYNATAPKINDSISGATLQLNAMLVTQEDNGTREKVYWAQDTPDFTTNASQISFGDNFWNNTDQAGFLSNSTLTSSNGNFVFPVSGNGSQLQYYYGFQTGNLSYVMPFDLSLFMNESLISGKGVLLQMGEEILRNGSVGSQQPLFWFDNITINDPAVQNAYFLVDGNNSTPIGTFYDAELVFCGQGNLESTNFTQMSSTLGLYYLSNASSFTPFPSYYSFGGDTGESADNLHVEYGGNGTAVVSSGTPNYVYLGSEINNSTTISSSSSSESLLSTFSPSNTSSNSSFSTTSSIATQSSSGATSISNIYLVALIPAILIIVALLAIILTRRKTVSDFPA